MRLRAVLIGALVLLVGGCGGGGRATSRCVSHGVYCENLPRHKVLHVDWKENVAFRPGEPTVAFHVRDIEVGPKGFKVRASFTNHAPTTLEMPAGTLRSPKDFGLGVFTDALGARVEDPGQYVVKATRFDPPLPHALAPGKTWSGTMSGTEPPRNRRWLRVLFGAFFWRGKPPAGFGPFFVYATTHNVRAPGPVGKPAASP